MVTLHRWEIDVERGAVSLVADDVRRRFCRGAFLLLTAVRALAPWPEGRAAEPEPYYHVVDILSEQARQHSRHPQWQPGEGIAMEVTGMAVMDGDRVAVAIRKGEVWLLDNAYGDPEVIRYTRFASGLDEPLGLIVREGDLWTVQRSELTRLRDLDQDDVADVYETAAKGWAVTGNYHGYAYGPVEDGNGDLWITLNLDIGGGDNSLPWHGWGLKLDRNGDLHPMCAGMRSPCGLGRNLDGDVFFTDQQGNWIPANSLHQLVPGAFYGNPDGLPPALDGSTPLGRIPTNTATLLQGKPYPEALKLMPQLRPPAVWFPYRKMGQSRTDLVLDDTGGKFGPFEGQFFVGEFTQSRIGRVFLETVDGEYQGACFPFHAGFPAGVMRLAFGRDGSLLVGMTNRGWSSVGGGTYGLQRLVWNGKTPFEIQEVRARPDGFELRFTQEVDRETASDVDSYRLSSYTYPLHSMYGAEELETKTLDVESATLEADNRTVRLTVRSLRPFHVHELHCDGVRSTEGSPLRHAEAYYTLNRIPK